MRYLILLTLALAGCGKTLVKPEVVEVVRRVPVAVPAELTRPENVPEVEGETVGDYLKHRLTLLYYVNLYAHRMKLIRELPGDE